MPIAARDLRNRLLAGVLGGSAFSFVDVAIAALRSGFDPLESIGRGLLVIPGGMLAGLLGASLASHRSSPGTIGLTLSFGAGGAVLASMTSYLLSTTTWPDESKPLILSVEPPLVCLLMGVAGGCVAGLIVSGLWPRGRPDRS